MGLVERQNFFIFMQYKNSIFGLELKTWFLDPPFGCLVLNVHFYVWVIFHKIVIDKQNWFLLNEIPNFNIWWKNSWQLNLSFESNVMSRPKMTCSTSICVLQILQPLEFNTDIRGLTRQRDKMSGHFTQLPKFEWNISLDNK